MYLGHFRDLVKNNLHYAIILFKKSYHHFFDDRISIGDTVKRRKRYDYEFFEDVKIRISSPVNLKKDIYQYFKLLITNKEKFFEFINNSDIRLELYIMYLLGYDHHDIIDFHIKFSSLTLSQRRKLSNYLYYWLKRKIWELQKEKQG